MQNEVQSLTFDNHQDIDSYLKSWLQRKENRNNNALLVEAHQLNFTSANLRKYFIDKGNELLSS